MDYLFLSLFYIFFNNQILLLKNKIKTNKRPTFPPIFLHSSLKGRGTFVKLHPSTFSSYLSEEANCLGKGQSQ